MRRPAFAVRVRALRRWTLRARLLAAVLTITAVGLLAFGLLTASLLSRSQLSRIDGQLNAVASDLTTGNRPPPPPVTESNDPRLPSTFRVLFFDNSGAPVGQIGLGASRLALPPMDAGAVQARGTKILTVPDESGAHWRVRSVVRHPNRNDPQGGTAAVVMSLDTYYATTHGLRAIEILAGIGLLVVTGGIAAWLVRVGLRPLTRIEQTAQAITAGDLDRRVADTDSRTEVGRLGGAFNLMLAQLSSTLRRLEESESRLRIFVADASHELRTPLTSIRGYAELYRHGGAATDAEVARMMGRIEEQATRMGVLVDDLLLLAGLDEQRPLDLGEVDPAALAADVVQDARVRYPERRVGLHVPAEAQRILADEGKLRQALSNLVTNALTHTPATAAVDVRVGRVRGVPGDAVAESGAELPAAESFVILEVADTGPGIPLEKAAHVFDRFYRVDESRSRSRGSGLGLAIVSAILTAHGARIQLVTGPGRGAIFRMVFAAGKPGDARSAHTAG